MIDLEYLKAKLAPFGYNLDTTGQAPIFFKRVMHSNPNSLYAFTLVMVTLDQYTVTIEGFNEMLINRAVKAGAIAIDTYEELDALREIVYDNTLEEVKAFETMLGFFEQQLAAVIEHPVRTDAHQDAIEKIQLMVEAAKAASI